MNAIETLQILESKDVKLDLQGEKIRCLADEGVMTPELVEAIKLNKAQIVTLLKREKEFKFPFPLGFKGLPWDAVTAGLAWANHIHQGEYNPVDERIDVYAWLLGDKDFESHPLYEKVRTEMNRLWEEEYDYKYET